MAELWAVQVKVSADAVGDISITSNPARIPARIWRGWHIEMRRIAFMILVLLPIHPVAPTKALGPSAQARLNHCMISTVTVSSGTNSAGLISVKSSGGADCTNAA